jgi:hypothetical protein
MEAPRTRRWIQFHLSTVFLLTVTAGILMWKNADAIKRLQPGVNSYPVTKDGLTLQLSIQSRAITIDSPAILKLELRNDSDSPFAVFSERMGWEEIEISPANETDIVEKIGVISCWIFPTLKDYMVLQPGQTIEHSLSLSVSGRNGIYNSEAYDYISTNSGKLLVRVNYSSYGFKEYLKRIKAEERLGAPIWSGDVSSAPVAIELFEPWSRQKVKNEIALSLFLLGLVAFCSEWTARRRHVCEL